MKLSFLTTAAVGLTILSGCCGQEDKVSIIPYPDKVEMSCGKFNAAGKEFHCDPQTDQMSKAVIEKFAAALSSASGKACTVTSGTGDSGFSFIVDGTLAAEAYTLDITRKGVTVRASGLNGFNYAIQSLKQMLPVAIYTGETRPFADWTLPCVSISDSPRFGYRGMHIDVARHFFDVNEMKKVLDVMEIHKLNTLHWHLTDDQGWRLPVSSYPELIAKGSVRKGTMVRKDWESSDNIPYGGHYTTEEIKDVIAYASSKGITVIPEIDLPGHMLAALTAYPEFGCTGGPYEVWGRWGVADDVLCAGNEKTMRFLEDVLSEVADLFPSEYIHIGGDECPKVRWEKCPKCQAKIKELGLKDDGEFKAEHYLQSYVMERMEKFLEKKGKKIIGWDEILEGKPGPNATIMSWRGSEGGIKASKMGHDVIMTPNSHFYFDYYQGADQDWEPFGIGGYIPLERVYSYEPYTEDMDADARGHILGVQANLWTEYVLDNDHLEYMLLPRMSALSEVQWCRPENKDWNRYFAGVSHLFDIYEALGYNYSTTSFGVHADESTDPKKGCVVVRLYTQGDAPIRYTLDGSEPDESSALYTRPLEIKESATLKATAFRPSFKTPGYSKSFIVHKAVGKPVSFNVAPLSKYTYGAPASLVNGIQGPFIYTSGDWAGWMGDPVDLTIDMGGRTAYSSVTMSALVQKGEYIFGPLDLRALVSDDGVSFTEVAAIEIPVEKENDPDGLKEYKVEFPETSARYLRVTSKTVNPIPEWHGAHGEAGFLFIDEIAVW